MQRPDYVPADYDKIQIVASLSALAQSSFSAGNCVLFPRSLTTTFRAQVRKADFGALAEQLATAFPYPSFDDDFPELVKPCSTLTVSDLVYAKETLARDKSAVLALDFILADIAKIKELTQGQINATLRVIDKDGYAGNDAPSYQFHADNDGENRWLCSYTSPVTEWVRNEDAVQNTSYRKYLFEKKEGAAIFRFGVGDIWKQQALNSMQDDDQPFIHRTPPRESTQGARLLLVAK